MDELTDVQRLAVAQAVYKAVSGVVSTKDENSLRSECDRVLVEQYEQTGAKSYDVPINGIKVGTYSVKVSKAKPKRKAPRAWVNDWDEFIDWLTHEEEADGWLRHLVEDHGDELALEILHETGEVAPGCVAQLDHCEPAEPARVTGTTLRVDVAAVAEAMGPMLGERVMGLLGGAE